MTEQQQKQAFFEGTTHAVVGASRDRAKYGNKVLRAYLQNGRSVFAVNPNAQEIEGLKAYPDLASLPEQPTSIVVITPPYVTETIVEQAARLGVKNIWLQPGAENERAVNRAVTSGMNVISGGPCVLVAMRFRE